MYQSHWTKETTPYQKRLIKTLLRVYASSNPEMRPALPELPKFAQLIKNLRIGMLTLDKRFAVYSNYPDVCKEVFDLLKSEFGDDVIFLQSKNSLDGLARWNSKCSNCCFLNARRDTVEPDRCIDCKHLLTTANARIVVIDTELREGIDLYWVSEMHLLDSCSTYADLVQVKARIARTQDPCKVNVGLANLDSCNSSSLRTDTFSSCCAL
jgi:hypothetical protein